MIDPNRKKALAEVDLYPVICGPRYSKGRSFEQVLDAVLEGGAKMVQLRAKDATGRERFRLAEHFRRRTAEYNSLLIVNDYLDVALACGADGVHLGQDDLPPEAARRIADRLIIGVSTHNLDQALEAESGGAGYVNIGPIYPTQTKEVAVNYLGPAAIGEIAPSLKIDFTVMGGIKMENIEAVLSAGARKIAVVTAVTEADDITAATRQLIKQIRNFK